MKFTIKTTEFLNALLNTSKIIPSKTIDPILSNIKIDLFEDKIELVGTNGELSIKSIIKRYVNDEEIFRDVFPGSILLNAKILTEIIRRLDENEVSFSIEDNSLAKIKTIKSTFNLNVLRSEEYRELDFEEGEDYIDFKSTDFIDAVNQTSFAASTKSRPILQCVNIENDGHKIYFVATDGSRLARKIIMLENNLNFNISIQAKNINEIVRTVTSEDEEVKMFVSERKVLFKLKKCIITSTLTAGEYPNTKNIIPITFKYTLETNANEFLKCLDRAVLLSVDRQNIIKLSLDENEVYITSKSQEIGDATEKVDLCKFTGERFSISFNVNYVTSAIKTLKNEDITIKFIAEMKPFVICDKNDENLVHLITPVRTSY